jgi:membrane protein DedA with SNARE-associated domain
MEEFVAWLQPIVERFGGVGMAIMAAIDCSFVSMPNIGRRSGEAFLLRRFKPEYVAHVRSLFARYGMWVIAVVAMLPPPAPYKVFVLLAGVGGVGPGMFALAVAIGRGLRYGIEGWLSRVYGAAAADLIRDNATAASLWLLALVLVAGLFFLWWRRRVGRSSAA